MWAVAGKTGGPDAGETQYSQCEVCAAPGISIRSVRALWSAAGPGMQSVAVMLSALPSPGMKPAGISARNANAPITIGSRQSW